MVFQHTLSPSKRIYIVKQMKDKRDNKIPTPLTHSVGRILRKERESRRLSIKDVSQSTAITPRYLEALEREDFSVFPSEMYAIGFLNNYADYLNLSQERLVTLFRQQQLDNKQSPIKELTKPSPFAILQRVVLWGPGLSLALGILALLGAIIFLPNLLGFFSFFQETSDSTTAEPYCSGERGLQVVNLPLKDSPPRSTTLSLNPPDSFRITVDNMSLKFCLSEVITTDDSPAIGIFHLRIDDKYNYEFRIQEEESFVLSADIEPLKRLSRKVKFTSAVLSDYSARIELETLEVTATHASNLNKRNQTALPKYFQNDIQVTLEFVKASYVQWTTDGKSHRGRIISAREVHTYEARNRLEIKVGNGSGVRIHREGTRPRIAGPAAKIVKLEYRRIPDPLDPGISKITELIEVVDK